MNCYSFIEAEKAGDHGVKRACELLQVSRSAYYADRSSGPSPREQRDAVLAGKIAEIHDGSRRTYGSPRVHHELRTLGERCSRKRVARLMRAADRYGRTPRRWNMTTIADPTAPTRPDLIGRDFAIDPGQAAALDARWCGDITYIHTWQGWLYLATVIDLARWSAEDLEAVALAINDRPRKVLGWKTPAEAFAEQLRSIQQPSVATTD